jgi:hypothetical protein
MRPLQAYCSSPGDCNVGHGMMISTEANSWLVYQSALAATSIVWWSCQQRHLWQPPVLSGSPVSRDLSGSHQYCLAVLSAETSLKHMEWAKDENLIYLSPWDFNRTLTCGKILWNGTSGFTSYPKESVLRMFITLKNPLPWPGSNPQPLGPVASTLTTTPPRQHIYISTAHPLSWGSIFLFFFLLYMLKAAECM